MSVDFSGQNIEGLERTRNQGANVNELDANDRIAIMKNLAPNFGVNIQILAEEGDGYSNEFTDKRGQRHVYNHTVPKGKSYVNVSSPKRDLHDFWEAVKTQEKAQQPPANPPKT